NEDTNMKTSKSLSLLCMSMTLAPIVSTLDLLAADSKDAPDPTGSWKWTTETQNGQTRESTVKLKLEGDKLTGTFMGRGDTEIRIQDGKYQQDQVSFSVVRERNGQQVTAKYSGKLAGDTIKGKIETERNGQTRSRDWVAKRETATVAGTWKW